MPQRDAKIGSSPVHLIHWLVLSISVLIAPVALPAAPPRRPAIAAFERFFTTGEIDVHQAGNLLLGELNCLGCHGATPAQRQNVLSKQAPVLDDVGHRVRLSYLRAFLADPQRVKPGTTMPNLFANVGAERRQDQIESLIHLLASTGKLADTAPSTNAVKQGKALFRSIGCLACHDQRQDRTTPLSTSVPLGTVADKYSIPGLTAFLQDPLRVRPTGRMPNLSLSPDEARHIASYLLKDIQVEPLLQYTYYEGSWQKLPDFSKLKPKATGKAAHFDVDVGRENQFAIRYSGLLQLPKAGEYTFHLGSDDGSRLLINQREVVKVDGIHPVQFRQATHRLESGIHDLVIEFFEQGGGQELRLDMEGPDIKRQPVTLFLTSSKNVETDNRRFTIDPDRIVAGRRLFASLGCASCHLLQRISPTPHLDSVPRLSMVATAVGCLGPTAQWGVPFYGLDDRQRHALAVATKRLQAADRPLHSVAEKIDQTLAHFNCFACHQRDRRGGVERARDGYFHSLQKEMGDEGRLPPALTGIGAKLRQDWLRRVFDQGSRERPYMMTRMPRFGTHNVASLIPAWELVDTALDAKPEVAKIPLRRLKAAGRQLTGNQGFSCVKCHTFAQHRATGIQALNLTSMTRRLKENWFHHYMLNPQTFRPGTRMPASWPNGQILLPRVLDGDADAQVHALWTYLADEDRAALPPGLLGQILELVATDEPVIYRNFIADAGPRAIGVGYPEKVNLAFDANQLRLALVWHNAFIDTSKHWRGRGQGFQQPLGDNVLKLHGGMPLAVLNDLADSWPATSARDGGYRFGGYRFDNRRRPTFRYWFGKILIEDYPAPVSAEPFAPLRRRLSITSEASVERLFFRAASANTITALGRGWFEIDDQWRMRVESASPAPPLVRTADKQVELLVPIRLETGKATLTQTFVW